MSCTRDNQSSETSRCPNLPKPEPAVAQDDNDTGGDALTPEQ